MKHIVTLINILLGAYWFQKLVLHGYTTDIEHVWGSAFIVVAVVLEVLNQITKR